MPRRGLASRSLRGCLRAALVRGRSGEELPRGLIELRPRRKLLACGACGSRARASLLGGLASIIGRILTPLCSLASPFSCALLIPGGFASPGPLLSLGMLFRESRALHEHLSRPLVDLCQARGYLPRTSSGGFRGGLGVWHIIGSCVFRSPGRHPGSRPTPRPRGLTATHTVAVAKQRGS